MRNKPEIITMSIDMYVSNLSSRKMRNQLKRHLSYKISHVSALDWVRRYTLKVHKFIEKQGYNLGNSFYADETLINREGKLELGENRWLDLIRKSAVESSSPLAANSFVKNFLKHPLPIYCRVVRPARP